MIKYITFTYNKHLYATCYGIDPFAAERCPYNNIFDPAAAGRGEMRCFSSLVGGDEYSLPRLQEAEITVADPVAKFLAGKGWIEVAGVRYDVTFDSNNIQCINPEGVDVNSEETITESRSTEEANVEYVTIPKEIEEIVVVPDEDPMEKKDWVAPTFEEVPESAETGEISEVATVKETSEVETPVINTEAHKGTTLKEAITESSIDLVKPVSLDYDAVPEETVSYSAADANFTHMIEIVSTEEPKELVDDVPPQIIEEVKALAEKNPAGIVTGVAEDFMNPPVEEPVVHKPTGIGFSGDVIQREPVHVGIQLGTTTSSAGIEFGTFKPRVVEPKPVHVQRKTYTVTGRPVQTQMYEPVLVQPIADVPVPSQAFAQAVAKSETELMESWREQAPADMCQRWDKPAISKEEKAPVIEEVPVVTDDFEKREYDKKAFLISVSADIARVIEKIPLSIIGPIAEFTTNPVNTRRLTNESDAYCIDNRWHKAGKWYCIDVVNDTARYFFNSRLNISIQIPQATLKEWLRVVNG